MALKSICGNSYTLRDVLGGFLVGNEASMQGYVLTWDSLCIGGGSRQNIIVNYKDINSVTESSFYDVYVVCFKGGTIPKLDKYDGTSLGNWLYSGETSYYYDEGGYLVFSYERSDEDLIKEKIIPFLMMVWRSVR